MKRMASLLNKPAGKFMRECFLNWDFQLTSHILFLFPSRVQSPLYEDGELPGWVVAALFREEPNSPSTTRSTI